METTIRDCDSLKRTVSRVAQRATATIDLRSEQFLRIETTLGKSNSEAAFAAIVRALYETFPNQIAHGILNFDFVRQIDVGRRAFLATVANLQEYATRQGCSGDR